MHYHGFGPWTGTRDEYAREGLRVPGHPAFGTIAMPPVQTGHALLRPRLVRGTWEAPGGAVEWLRRTYAAYPPGRPSGTPEDWFEIQEDSLTRGSDVVWGYYLASGAYCTYSAVCCPNKFCPGITCPDPG